MALLSELSIYKILSLLLNPLYVFFYLHYSCVHMHAYMRNEIRVMSKIHYPDTVYLILDVVKLKNKKPRETNGSFAKNLRMLEPNDDFDYKLPV